MTAPRDPGLAQERTTLAWHRTGLSALALAALASHSFQDRPVVAVPVAGLLAALGLIAYRTGSAAGPTHPRRLRLVSMGVTVAALASGAGTIVG